MERWKSSGKNSPIVILDEATAFTDQENEEKIQRSIAALTKGKTLILIAHRLNVPVSDLLEPPALLVDDEAVAS